MVPKVSFWRNKIGFNWSWSIWGRVIPHSATQKLIRKNPLLNFRIKFFQSYIFLLHTRKKCLNIRHKCSKLMIKKISKIWPWIRMFNWASCANWALWVKHHAWIEHHAQIEAYVQINVNMILLFLFPKTYRLLHFLNTNAQLSPLISNFEH